ncbi:hypothetical protein EYC80_001340 [Monilinia laxa]|uniref:Secreted protein n=1 Tax=Monilinia laxa TaxID=61186 RepID=A0A5N6K954_MONLA|nr:hypothetical protein EYC80_001340 [Monilinia laxa]
MVHRIGSCTFLFLHFINFAETIKLSLSKVYPGSKISRIRGREIFNQKCTSCASFCLKQEVSSIQFRVSLLTFSAIHILLQQKSQATLD